MEVLQITTGFNHSSIYEKLFTEMHKQEISISVFVPEKKYTSTKSIKKDEYPYTIHSTRRITKIDTLLYFPRVQKMVKDVEENFDLTKIEISHAHSLFSDGAVAYQLYKKHDIPYIVAIRGTDISKYVKYAPHLKKYGRKILDNASHIIFLSEPYKNILFHQVYPSNKDSLIEKSLVIPNGIDNFWHNNRDETGKKNKSKKIKLIFVGQLIKRKNPRTVIKVAQYLSSQNYDVELLIVGDGELRNELEDITKELNNIQLLGNVSDKNELWDHYAYSDILVVPSYTETFGLVYAEAMSTGTPVIYTKGQGFDGVFNNGEVGYAVSPEDIKEISKAILDIKDNFDIISKNAREGSKRFNWPDIVNLYSTIYDKKSRD